MATKLSWADMEEDEEVKIVKKNFTSWAHAVKINLQFQEQESVQQEQEPVQESVQESVQEYDQVILLNCLECAKVIPFSKKKENFFLEKGYDRPKFCYDCKQKKGGKNLTCLDCLEDFYFSKKSMDYFSVKGFKDPKRCFKCRADKDKKI